MSCRSKLVAGVPVGRAVAMIGSALHIDRSEHLSLDVRHGDVMVASHVGPPASHVGPPAPAPVRLGAFVVAATFRDGHVEVADPSAIVGFVADPTYGDWLYIVEPAGTREQYARGYAVARDLELHVAVEIRGGEDGNAISELLRGWAEEALAVDSGDHAAAVDRLERWIAGQWLGEDRAYFIETDQHNRGLQIYQPYGRPRIR